MILHLPQLKVVKPSDTRWLSHERCVRAICKELPALIIPLQQLHESSGDAEAFGISTLLASQVGISCIVLLSEVLDLLAKLNTFMQKKTADFSRLPGFMENILDEIESLKREDAKWCTDVNFLILVLEQKHNIIIGTRAGVSRGPNSFDGVSEYQKRVTVPYLSVLIENIKRRFSDIVVKLLVASSIFCPSKLPPKDQLGSYGCYEIDLLSNFYGRAASVEYEGATYTSPPLRNAEDLVSEWKMYRRAMLQEQGMKGSRTNLLNLN